MNYGHLHLIDLASGGQCSYSKGKRQKHIRDFPSSGLCLYRPLFASIAGAVLLSGCSVGPDYHQPEVPQPVSYKEGGPAWKEGQPSDAISKGDWYTIFHDPKLNQLEVEAQNANQNLRAVAEAAKQHNAIGVADRDD